MPEKREMTAVEYFKNKSRMTNNCEGLCAECNLGSYKNGTRQGCGEFQLMYPEKAVAIVQKWSEEHPQKTFLSDFLEKYPNALMDEKGFPKNVCPFDLGYINAECISFSPFNDRCRKCWDRPLEG